MLYQQSQTWSKAPADLMFIDDPYPAYCLNEYVWAFGRWVESKLDAVKPVGKNEKPERTQRRRNDLLANILAGNTPSSFPQKFAEPPGQVVRRG